MSLLQILEILRNLKLRCKLPSYFLLGIESVIFRVNIIQLRQGVSSSILPSLIDLDIEIVYPTGTT